MKQSNYQKNIKYMVLSAVFAAMVFVLTAFVHIPTHQGYVHVGDGIIYLSAAILPGPYAAASAAIGAGLSDYMSGYAIWVIPTAIIKGLTAFCFSSKKETIICKRNFIAIIPAALICVGGYFIAGALLAVISGTPIQAALIASLADIPSNGLQAAARTVLFIILGASLDRVKIKNHL